jgi:hypothetical protein
VREPLVGRIVAAPLSRLPAKIDRAHSAGARVSVRGVGLRRTRRLQAPAALRVCPELRAFHPALGPTVAAAKPPYTSSISRALPADGGQPAVANARSIDKPWHPDGLRTFYSAVNDERVR